VAGADEIDRRDETLEMDSWNGTCLNSHSIPNCGFWTAMGIARELERVYACDIAKTEL
jgi:hypothetical protein